MIRNISKYSLWFTKRIVLILLNNRNVEAKIIQRKTHRTYNYKSRACYPKLNFRIPE